MKIRMIKNILIPLFCVASTTIAQEVLTSQRPEEDRRYRLARQYEADENFLAALGTYQSLWNDHMKNLAYYQGVKNNLLRLGRFDEALQAVRKMMQVNSSFYIESDLGDVLFQAGEKEKALTLWYDMIDRNKNRRDVYQSVASMMINNRMIDEAIKVYRFGLDRISTDNSFFLLEIANLYSARLDYKEATSAYLQYIAQEPKQFAYIERQIMQLAKNIEDVGLIIEILRQQQKTHREPVLLKKMMTALYVQNSDYENALKEYQSIADTSPSLEGELFDFAVSIQREGAHASAEKAFDLFIARYPQSPLLPQAKFEIAEAAHAGKQYSKAIASYEQIIAQFPSQIEAKKAAIQLGMMKLEYFKDPEGAKQAFCSILEKYPTSQEHFEVMLKIGDCEIALGALDRAREWYQKVSDHKNVSQEMKERASFRMALIQFWSCNFESAQNQLAQIIDAKTDLQREKRGFFINDALELNFFIEDHRQDLDMLKDYARSMLLVEQNRPEDALAQLKKLLTMNPDSELGDDASFTIGEIETSLGRYQNAVSVYRELIRKYPQSIYADVAQKKIAEIYELNIADMAAAITEYELVLVNYPESLFLAEVRKKIRFLEKQLIEGRK